jgi:hypothetical protein
MPVARRARGEEFRTHAMASGRPRDNEQAAAMAAARHRTCGAAGTGGAGTPSCQCSSGSNTSLLPLEHQITTAHGTALANANAPAAMAAGCAPTAAPLPHGRVLGAPVCFDFLCLFLRQLLLPARHRRSNKCIFWISHGINAVNFPH